GAERHVRIGALAGGRELRRVRAVPGGIAHARPGNGRLRRQEAVGTARVVAVRYALERERAVDGEAAQATAGGLDDGEEAGWTHPREASGKRPAPQARGRRMSGSGTWLAPARRSRR